jgi:hypothetical protein
MSATEQLGNRFNVVPIAASQALSLKGTVGVTFVTTGSDTFTLTTSAVFGSGFASPGTLTCNVYKNAQTNGTAAWVLDNTLITNNTIITTVATAFFISAIFLPDLKVYVKLTPSGGGLVTAILGDLTVKRTPPNLAIVGV